LVPLKEKLYMQPDFTSVINVLFIYVLLHNISVLWQYLYFTFTLTLMTEAEEISETLVFNSTLKWLFAQEGFNIFICCDRFKCYKNFKLCLKSYMLSSFKVGPKPLHYFNNHHCSCPGLCQQAYTCSSPLCTIINNKIRYKTTMKQSSIHSYHPPFIKSEVIHKLIMCLFCHF
jgi:hypothetical protein